MKASGLGKHYPFPTVRGSRHVEAVYVRELRRKFKLTAKDGVTDEAFWG